MSTIKSEKKVSNDSSLVVRKVSPIGSNYFRRGDLTGTSSIEFCFSIATLLMQEQSCEFVPVDVVLAIADEFSLDLSTEKKTAKQRVIAHCNHSELNIATIEDVVHTLYIKDDIEITIDKAFTVSGNLKKGVIEVEKPFYNSLIPSMFFKENIDNILYDFPDFDFALSKDSLFLETV